MPDELVTVKITGLKEIEDALQQQIPKKAKAAVRAALRSGATMMKVEVVRNAPKDTGLLADHIDIKTSVRQGGMAGASWIGPNSKVAYPELHRTSKSGLFGRKKRDWHASAAWIAKLHEFGTSKMPARPFMTRAFEQIKGKVFDAIVTKLKEGLGL